MADDLIATLLDNTGLYIGTDRDPTDSGPVQQVARIKVTALPGRVGVTFDYDGLTLSDEHPRGHGEHSVLARTSHGPTLYSAHIHANVMIELRETTPGYFVAVEGSSPFPMAIRIEVPEAGHLIYTWSFGMPGEELQVRNVGDVRRVD